MAHVANRARAHTASGPVNRSAGTHNYTVAAPGGFNPGSNLANVFLTTTDAASTIRFSGFGSDVYAVGGLLDVGKLQHGAIVRPPQPAVQTTCRSPR